MLSSLSRVKMADWTRRKVATSVWAGFFLLSQVGLAAPADETAKRPTANPAAVQSTSTERLIRQADEHYALGKQAVQEGRVDDARREFDRAVESLLTSADNNYDQAIMEHRLEELVDSIYRYDLDQLGAGNQGETVREKRPIDEILEMTFPVDPAIRGRVREQVQSTVSELPLEENDAVLSFINFFSTTRGKKILASGLRRSGRYKAMIDRILAEEGVPEELIFVAQAESGFQPRAVSNMLCVGVWQFAKFRGQEYGLQVNASVDERMDPEKATRAAARHLRDLYTHFGDWYLALAAYNCGPGCVDRAVFRTGYADFFQLRRASVLPQQTAAYVPAILAMTIMAKNAKDYGLDDVEAEKPLEWDTLELDSSTRVELFAAALDVPLSELKELNPALRKATAPAGYLMRLPKGTVEQVSAALRVVPVQKRDAWRIQRVESSDSFLTLAKRFNTAPALISSANQGEMPEAGSFAAIPVSYPVEKAPVRAASKRTPAKKYTTAARAGSSAGKTNASAKSAAPARPTSLSKPSASRTPKTVAKRTPRA